MKEPGPAPFRAAAKWAWVGTGSVKAPCSGLVAKQWQAHQLLLLACHSGVLTAGVAAAAAEEVRLQPCCDGG